MEKKVAVFCSASYTIDPAYNDAARRVIRALCAEGYSIVSGGTIKGTMGVISEEIAACGGKHYGIIPRFMQSLVYPEMTQTIWTDTMAERKALMREDSYAIVALPGGIGTLDELIETLTLAKLGKYSGKIIAYDVNGFYAPLKDLLDHYVKTEMMTQKERDLISFPSNVDDLLKELGR